MSRFLKELDRRTIVFDGSMGATLQNVELDVERDYLGRENCVDVLVRSRPELIQELHESFLEVGVDAVETDTFGAAQHILSEFDDELTGWTRSLNKQAAEIARAACDRYSTKDKPRFVIGSIGPGTKLITLNQISWDQLLASYTEQARGLIDGGVDAFIIETCQDLLQVKCVINACLNALAESGKSPENIPLLVSVTIETTGTMLVGSEISAVTHALQPFPIASLGLNCATGPTEMRNMIEYLAKHWDRAISVIPNAGLPVMVEGKTEFPLQPADFAQALQRYVTDFGVNIVGGCCGTTVDHLKSLVQSIASGPPSAARPTATLTPSCTSLYTPTEYEQELSFLIVGERMNAFGSRKFKRLLEEENWDEIVSLARDQIKGGAHILDLNVDYAGRDNPRDAVEIVTRVVRQVNAPLMLDSTQMPTLEAGLKHSPGKCIINSANFEDGDGKFDQICSLATTYGAAIVIGTIDEDEEQAMARTADRKVAITERAIERAVNHHGIALSDIFIDPLVLPISTGLDSDRRSALELIEGTRRIADTWPAVQILCGLSNVSFGLKPAARIVLNSMLLTELTDVGLTSAIVHASKILPLNRIPKEQQEAAHHLIHDCRDESLGGTGLPDGITDKSFDPLQAFVELFTDASETTVTTKATRFTLEEQLQRHIIEGDKKHLEDHLDVALGKYSPLDIINDHLLAGMKVVGELFGSGQMQLPFVLQSAEVMKRAVSILEPFMKKSDGNTKGSIVLATVKGDVHDIGKNLVDIILTNNGYTVHNIGIKQPIGSIVDALKEHKADAIGMSGLLVKSVIVMEENLKELNGAGVGVPVLLGGAALSRKYAEGHLRQTYSGDLYYGKDAFEGLRIMDAMNRGELQDIDNEINSRARKHQTGDNLKSESLKSPVTAASRNQIETASQLQSAGGTSVLTVTRSEVARRLPTPVAPFLGNRVIDTLPLNQIYPYINTNALFRGQWGFKRGSKTKAEYEAIITDAAIPTFDRLKTTMQEENVLQPHVVYGYYPCLAEQNDLVIFDPKDQEREIERFRFPRQADRRKMCIADFYRERDELDHQTDRDVIGFFVCTMGELISQYTRQLFDADEYTEYLYVHGLGVEATEGLAELWHKRMREELGIAGDDAPEIRRLFQQAYRGSRYSFGYPACPEMSDQAKLFRLLNPERIGCHLTENFQIDPEQSVSALIVHHPEAKYFNT